MHDFAKKIAKLITGIIFIVLFNNAFAAELMKIGKGKVGFWIGSDKNEIFNKKTLEFIADKAGAIVLNIPLESKEREYGLKEIIERLHQLQPGLPVFFYTWGSRWYQGARVGSEALKDYPKLGKLLLYDEDGKLIKGRDGKLLYGDVTKKEYRVWVIDKIKKMLDKTGADGVALDVVTRSPPQQLKYLCAVRQGFCEEYADGMENLLAELKNKIKPKLVLYNGLWNQYEGQLEDQEKLLQYADAVAIEWFGRYPFKKAINFEGDILPYLRVIKKYKNKLFMVFGRGSWTNYDKFSDKKWQRYLYASYLLVAGRNTLYKYQSSFQVPPHAGLSGGLTYYDDWNLNIDINSGEYSYKDGLYKRVFKNACVIVVPNDYEKTNIRLSKTCH